MTDEAADDALQEAFVKVLRSGKRFSQRQQAVNYLYRAVLTSAIDIYRKRRRRVSRFQAGPDNLQESDELAGDSRRHCSLPDPLENLLERERRGWEQALVREVRRAWESLPAPQREAIDLALNRNGKSFRAVCAEAGIPYSTARSRMLVGIDQIRKHLNRKHFLAWKRIRS